MARAPAWRSVETLTTDRRRRSAKSAAEGRLSFISHKWKRPEPPSPFGMPCRVHVPVEDADDLYMVAAFAEDDQVSALEAAVKAGAEIVAGLTQGSVDREPLEPGDQGIDGGHRLGFAPSCASVVEDVRQIGFRRRGTARASSARTLFRASTGGHRPAAIAGHGTGHITGHIKLSIERNAMILFTL